MLSDIANEYEALIQFLYLAPVGLAQTTADGEIVMINPISAPLLMPLSRDGDLSNLFTALADVARDLRHLAAAFEPAYGQICRDLRIQIRSGNGRSWEPQVLSLSLLKLDDARLMAVLSDATMSVRQERLLKQNEAWFNAILTGITDYDAGQSGQRGTRRGMEYQHWARDRLHQRRRARPALLDFLS